MVFFACTLFKWPPNSIHDFRQTNFMNIPVVLVTLCYTAVTQANPTLFVTQRKTSMFAWKYFHFVNCNQLYHRITVGKK